jgi:hypothetical protein
LSQQANLCVHATSASCAFRACGSSNDHERQRISNNDDNIITMMKAIQTATSQSHSKLAAPLHRSGTCFKARVVVEHVDLLSAQAAVATSEWPIKRGKSFRVFAGVSPARWLVEHAVDVGQQQAHVSARLHSHQRRKAIVVAEHVSEYLQGRGGEGLTRQRAGDSGLMIWEKRSAPDSRRWR